MPCTARIEKADIQLAEPVSYIRFAAQFSVVTGKLQNLDFSPGQFLPAHHLRDRPPKVLYPGTKQRDRNSRRLATVTVHRPSFGTTHAVNFFGTVVPAALGDPLLCSLIRGTRNFSHISQTLMSITPLQTHPVVAHPFELAHNLLSDW